MTSLSGSVATTRATGFRLTSADGMQIACARWDSRGPVVGAVQIAHGMGEHIGRYADVIEVLVSTGLTVTETIIAGTATLHPPPRILGISARAVLTYS